VDAAAVRRLAARRARTSATRHGTLLDAPAPGEALEETVPQQATAPQEETAPHGPAEHGPAEHGPAARRLIATVALAVATLVLGGLAAWSGTAAGSLRGQPSAGNQALANPTETSQVTSQVTAAINALFSYNYASPGTTAKAASRLLTGAAVRQYAALFATVERKGPAEKLVVTTAVSSACVELLTRGTARVLVFATETEGSAGAGTPSAAGAMLAVNMVLDGGAWKIAGIDTFSG
jgi:Mce-associated membrane protein